MLRYYQHFGLQRDPFVETADPHFYLELPSVRRNVSRALTAIEQSRGLIVVVGPPGAGKTSLAMSIERSLLADENVVIGKITDPAFTSDVELLLAVGRVFGLTMKSRSSLVLKNALKSKLFFDAVLVENRTLVLLIDDAQKLSDESLEALRTLMSFQINKKNLLNLILCGQDELARSIEEHEYLKDRVDTYVRLERLDAAASAALIEYRLARAGKLSSGVVLTPDALGRAIGAAGGLPRRLTAIARSAMIEAARCRTQIVCIDHVVTALRNVGMTASAGVGLLENMLSVDLHDRAPVRGHPIGSSARVAFVSDERYERSADMRLLDLQREAIGAEPHLLPAKVYIDRDPLTAELSDVDSPGAILVAQFDAKPRSTLVAGELIAISFSIANDGDATAENVRAGISLPADTVYRAGSFTTDGVSTVDELAYDFFADGAHCADISPAARRTLRLELAIETGAVDIILSPHVSAAAGPIYGLRSVRLRRAAPHLAYGVEVPTHPTDVEHHARKPASSTGHAPVVEPAESLPEYQPTNRRAPVQQTPPASQIVQASPPVPETPPSLPIVQASPQVPKTPPASQIVQASPPVPETPPSSPIVQASPPVPKTPPSSPIVQSSPPVPKTPPSSPIAQSSPPVPMTPPSSPIAQSSPPVQNTTPVPPRLESSAPMPPRLECSAPVPARAESSSPVPARAESSAFVPVRVESSAPMPVRVESSAPMPMRVESSAPEPARVESSASVPARVESNAPVPARVESSAPVPTRLELSAPVPARVESSAPAPAPLEFNAPESAQLASIAAVPTPQSPRARNTPAKHSPPALQQSRQKRVKHRTPVQSNAPETALVVAPEAMNALVTSPAESSGSDYAANAMAERRVRSVAKAVVPSMRGGTRKPGRKLATQASSKASSQDAVNQKPTPPPAAAEPIVEPKRKRESTKEQQTPRPEPLTKTVVPSVRGSAPKPGRTPTAQVAAKVSLQDDVTPQPTLAPEPVLERTIAPPSPALKPTLIPPAPISKSTPAPSSKPTPAPSSKPTPAPSSKPTPAPILKPTPAPILKPTPAPHEPIFETSVGAKPEATTSTGVWSRASASQRPLVEPPQPLEPTLRPPVGVTAPQRSPVPNPTQEGPPVRVPAQERQAVPVITGDFRLEGKGGPILTVPIDRNRLASLARLFRGPSLGMIAHYFVLNALAATDALPGDGHDRSLAAFVKQQERFLARALVTARLGRIPATDMVPPILPMFPPAISGRTTSATIGNAISSEVLLVRAFQTNEIVFLERMLSNVNAPPFLRAAQLFVGLCGKDVVASRRDSPRVSAHLTAYAILATTEISRIFLRTKLTRTPELFKGTEPVFDDAARKVLHELETLIA